MIPPNRQKIEPNRNLFNNNNNDVAWSRDSEHLRHLSAVDRNPLAGSTLASGPAIGDSFSLLCLALLI